MHVATIPSHQGSEGDKVSRSSEDSRLKAPLYNDRSNPVEDDAALKEAERKLSADVADKTLILIDDILNSFDDVATEHKHGNGLASDAAFGRAREMYANMVWLLLWCGAGVAIIFVWIQDLNRYKLSEVSPGLLLLLLLSSL